MIHRFSICGVFAAERDTEQMSETADKRSADGHVDSDDRVTVEVGGSVVPVAGGTLY
jgi:hypothetical protein